jgi:formylglycine-generating enzyme required for sulfatase activity
LLGILAAKTFVSNRYFFSEEIAVREIEIYLKKYFDLKANLLLPDCKEILESIEEQHGLVVKRAKDIYSFSHLSVQEFLTAKYIVDNRDSGTLTKLIDKHILNKKWREVFLLTTGLLLDADSFFLQFRNKLTSLADSKLKTFFKKIDRTIKPCSGRTRWVYRLYIFLAIAKKDNIRDLIKQFKIDMIRIDDIYIQIPQEAHSLPDSFLFYAEAAKLFVDCLIAECEISQPLKKQLLDSLFFETWEYRKNWEEKHVIIVPSVNKKRDLETFQIPLKLPEELVPLKFVMITAGSFIMGEKIEQRKVMITNDFFLGKYPITQAQWQVVMGENPSRFRGNPNHPVENVSWDDCQEFLQKLEQMGLGKFRLPSEAEFEYACRAGTTTNYYWGDDPDEEEIWNNAWFIGNSFGQTHEVGKRRANRWGLSDMSGNVWEWCEDVWHNNYEGAPEDGQAWVINDNNGINLRVLRGGSWDNYARDCLSVNRFCRTPDSRIDIIGFRIVLSRT